MLNTEKTMEKIVALCKGRGFIFPGSEIYGGLANTWDYGPLGVEFKNNVKKAWWKKFVQESEHNVGLDAAILMLIGTAPAPFLLSVMVWYLRAEMIFSSSMTGFIMSSHSPKPMPPPLPVSMKSSIGRV